MKRTYENALRILESRRRRARPKDISAVSAVNDMTSLAGTQALRGVPSLTGMKEWLEVLGHSDRDINDLNIIHVAGTKGKGSTCAFTRSFLRAHSLRTGFPRKIGLYTSPDLRCIRERIQINDQPVMEDMFTRYFFEVWEKLSSQDSHTLVENTRQPRYLQLLALVAFHTFIREQVDAAIFETHHGGEYDATNVIPQPVATGITSIGMDHVAQLGPTIEDIAWHKAGIFKPGASAFSAPQDPGLTSVIRSRAAEKGVDLMFVSVDHSLPLNVPALSIPVQRVNCSLALALARTFLHRKSPGEPMSEDDILHGVERFSWPGRFEIINEGNCQWFLDGAHNELSVEQAAEWFAKNTSQGENSRILIFSHFSEERDGAHLLEHLATTLMRNNLRPNHVIFTTYQEREDGTTRIDKSFRVPEIPFPDFQAVYSKIWNRLDPKATVLTEPTIEGALNAARRIGERDGGMQTLVTGSLHLVGGALNLLRPSL